MMSGSNDNTYRELCARYNDIHDIDGNIFDKLKQLMDSVHDANSKIPRVAANATQMMVYRQNEFFDLQEKRRKLLAAAKKIHANL